MVGTPAPYVRLIEHVFRARVTGKDDTSGEWRYAWTEQRFEVDTGAWADAVPPRFGTLGDTPEEDRNYATELSGRELPAAGELYWMLLKGSVAGQLVYEVVGCCGGTSYDFAAPVTWTTAQNDWEPPPGASTIVVTLPSANVSLTGVVLQTNQTLTFVNSVSSAYSLLIPNQSTSSSSGNRITTPTTQTLSVLPGGSITLWRDPAAGVVVRDLQTVPCPKKGPQTATLTTSQNDYPIGPGVDVIRFTLTSSDLDLTGLVPHDLFRTQTVVIELDESSTKLLTLKHQSGSSTVSSRFDFPDSADLILRPGTTTGKITRDSGTTTRWRKIDFPGRQPWRPTWGVPTIDNPALPIGRLPDVLRPTLAGDTTLTGFPARFPVGQPLIIVNPTGSGFDLTIAHAAGTSDLDFSLSRGADAVLPPGGSMTVVSDGAKVMEAAASGAVTAPAYEQDVGDGVTTSIVVPHGLGSDAVSVTVIRNSDDRRVEVPWAATALGSITLDFSAGAPAAAEYRVVVLPVGGTASGGATSVNGSGSGSGAVTVTTAWTDLGASVSLPGAGTYLLVAQTNGFLAGPSTTASVLVRLYDVTRGAQVGEAAYAVTARSSDLVTVGGSAPLLCLLTVSAATTVRVEGEHNDTMGAPSTASAYAKLSYVKLA